MVIIEQCSNNKRTGYAHRKKAGTGVQALVTKTRRKRSTKGEATKSGHTDTGLPALLLLGEQCSTMTTVAAVRMTPGDSSV